MKVSEKIKELRSKRGWSQEQMAEKLNVSRQAVTKWETGAGAPDIENLAAIAQLFGVSTDVLIFGENAAGESSADRFESITAVDIADENNFDIKIGCAHSHGGLLGRGRWAPGVSPSKEGPWACEGVSE